jgi:acetyl-CoA carboxylase carboxyltransferase component
LKGDKEMTQDILTTAEQEKIRAKLEEGLARLTDMDATARREKSQTVIDAIVALRLKREEIQKRLRALNDANQASASQIKAEIEEKLANFEEEVLKLVSKVKSKSASR